MNIDDILENLTEREKKVLKERVGIDLDTPIDLDLIKRKFDVTREDIKLIEKEALYKLTSRGSGDPDDP